MRLEFPTTAGEMARTLGAEIIGDEAAEIHGLSSLDSAGKGSLTFFANKKYGEFLAKAGGAVLLTSSQLVQRDLPLTYIVVNDPQTVFAGIAKELVARFSWKGISPQACVDPSAILEDDVHVAPFAVIGEGAKIGKGTVVYPHAVIGSRVVIGESCQIHSRVVLQDRVRIGNRVKIFAGAVLGSDGFGFFEGGGRYAEMPQVGTVVVEDDVRIGALCTIDRATLGETRIGAGSKLDDHVHVGHNCRIGKNVILCAQVGIAGSTTLEDDVILAGQVGLGHGVHVGKGVRMAGQSGSSANLKAGETYFQSPAVPIREAFRIIKYSRKLPELWKRLRELETRFEEKKKD